MTAAFSDDADTVFPLPPVDPDTVIPKGDPLCQVCEKPLPWSGKGFRPRYCTEHKPSRSGGKRADSEPAAARKPAAPRGNAAVNRAVDSLEMLYGMGGTALRVTIAPNIGSALVDKRTELAESYRMLLESNAAVRKWFAEAEGKAAWLPILVVHADLAMNVYMQSAVNRAAAKAAANESEPVWEPTVVTEYYDAPARPDGA